MAKKKKRGKQHKKKLRKESDVEIVRRLTTQILKGKNVTVSTPAALRKQISNTFDILRQIRIVQEKKKSPSRKEEPGIDVHTDFVNWFERYRSGNEAERASSEKENGSKEKASTKLKESIDLHPGESDEGNGVFATRAIKENEILFEVPYHLIMHELGAQKSLASLMDKCPSLSRLPSLLMAMYVVSEKLKGPESFFESYISTFPVYFTIPLCNESSDEFEILQGTTTYSKATSLFLSTVRHYAALWHAMDSIPVDERVIDLSKFTWSTFRWAVAVVMTRQNKIPIASGNADDGKDAVTHTIALVPLFDAVNHESGGRISTDCKPFEVVDGRRGVLRCYAMRSFDAGEQVRMYYGDRTDVDFVLYSGFLPDRPRGPAISIDIRLNSNDPLAKLKNLIIFGGPRDKGLVVTVPVEFGPKDGDGPLPSGGLHQLMRMLRVVVASKDETASLLRSKHQKGAGDNLAREPLSKANESRAMDMLGDICRRRLKMYPVPTERLTTQRKQVSASISAADAETTTSERFRWARQRTMLDLLLREQHLLRRLMAYATETRVSV